jgi:hypothetical protein
LIRESVPTPWKVTAFEEVVICAWFVHALPTINELVVFTALFASNIKFTVSLPVAETIGSIPVSVSTNVILFTLAGCCGRCSIPRALELYPSITYP